MEHNALPEVTQAMLAGIQPGPSPEHIRAAIERYALCMTNGDTEGLVALFVPDAVIEDPIGSPPRVGAQTLRAFFRASFEAMGGGIEMVLEGAVRVAGAYGAAALRVRTLNFTDPMEIETLDVMRFDEQGRIASMTAYWGPSNVRPLSDEARCG